jgi:small subunit ribosomal protein S11
MTPRKQRLTTQRKKIRLQETEGIAYIYTTFNNTIVTITDKRGNVLTWSSCGKIGYKGSKKSTSYAAQRAAIDAAETALGMGLTDVHVRVNGPGPGRDSAIRALDSKGLRILSLKDITPIPHNGCRPPKRRRI